MPYDDLLFHRLRSAARPELYDLVGSVGLAPTKMNGARDEGLVPAISAALRRVAGNAIANRLRDEHGMEASRIRRATW